MTEHSPAINPVFDPSSKLETAISEQELMAKLGHYKLSHQLLCDKLCTNLTKLKLAELNEKVECNIYLQQLVEVLKKTNKNSGLPDLTRRINQLIDCWLNAMQAGASTQNILNLIQCIDLKSHFLLSRFGATRAQNLHLFLFDLLAETSHKQQQSTIDYALNYDSGTQLPNANHIFKHLTKVANEAKGNQLIGLASIRFQSTKNQLSLSKALSGHLNQLIAKILHDNIPVEAMLYVVGSAQFDVIIPKLTDSTQLTLLAAKLSRAFEQMLVLDKQSYMISPFIGAAYAQAEQLVATDLYENAQLALESAVEKQASLVIYAEALKDLQIAKSKLENQVLEAFSNDNLTLFLQPIVNISNQKCVGAELLLRWTEKTNNTIYPSLTIEILNKAGKGKLFTRWLINSACRYASELIQQHELKIYLTLNLRAEDLYDIELPHMLLQAINLWQLKPKDIILEITENGILEYNEITSMVIKQLADNGFRFALDDFGTGYSSFSRLRTMPIDLIKIDQSFVREMASSKDDYEIVQSIALLAKSLGKEVLAEGVEDKVSLALLEKLGIDKCQGYYFAKPMPFEKFVDWAKLH